MEDSSLSGHNHVTLGKPHHSLSLSLTLQTMGSPQGPLSSEGSEDRTWVLESEHLMPKGLTRTTPPHPETSGTCQPLCLWTSYLKNSPSSCFEHSGQPAMVSCGFTLAPAPGLRVAKQSGSSGVCCLPYSSLKWGAQAQPSGGSETSLSLCLLRPLPSPRKASHRGSGSGCPWAQSLRVAGTEHPPASRS